jgi:hypothetical protein
MEGLAGAGLRGEVGGQTWDDLRDPGLSPQGERVWLDKTAGIMAMDQPGVLLKMVVTVSQHHYRKTVLASAVIVHRRKYAHMGSSPPSRAQRTGHLGSSKWSTGWGHAPSGCAAGFRRGRPGCSTCHHRPGWRSRLSWGERLEAPTAEAGPRRLPPVRAPSQPPCPAACRGRAAAPEASGPPSRPGEFHPEPLTEPDRTLSRHPARATGRRLPPSVENLGFLLLPVDPRSTR